MSGEQGQIELHVFDPLGDCVVLERRLPHWSQPGTVAFITWRTNDSMPADVLRVWKADRSQWLVRHGILASSEEWRHQLAKLPQTTRSEFYREFSDRWHAALDAGYGDCVLRQPNVATVVANSLLFFDGDRYEMTDFVVMPNHVHLLAAFRHATGMVEQCESWKHFQASQIHRITGKKGRFWQQDGFDHLVRSVEQWEYLRRYIAENGPKAGLSPDEYIHYSKDLREIAGAEA